jgi:putative transposase
LKAAIARVLGSPWQRCTVHVLRDLRGHARKDQHDALGALIRQLFTAPDAGEARRRLGDAVTQLQARLPKVAALLEDAEDDVLAFYGFPTEHWPKLRSTIRLSASTARSAAEPTSSASSPTTPR